MANKAPKQNIYLLCLVLLSFVLFILGIYDRHFVTRGEGREALVAQSMFDEGNWILPSGYGSDIPSKPPLLHWAISIASWPQGFVSEFTARLPSALFAFLGGLIFYFYLSRKKDQYFAFAASLVLATCFEWYKCATSARVDMVFSTMLFWGLISVYEWSKNNSRPMLYSAICCLALATVSKGPVSIVLPGVIFTLYLLFYKKTGLKAAFSKLTLIFVPVLLISSVWYLAAFQIGGINFYNKVYDENVGRFTGQMVDVSHKHGTFYLVFALIVGVMPWMLVLVSGLFKSILIKKSDKKGIKQSILESWNICKKNLSANDFDFFAFLSFICFLIFFSIPSSKRGVYLLPIYPFVAYALTVFLFQMEKKYQSLWIKINYAFVALYSLLCLLAVFVLVFEKDLLPAKYQHNLKVNYYLEQIIFCITNISIAGLFLFLSIIVLFAYLLLKKKNYTVTFAGIFVCLITLIQLSFNRPISNDTSSKDFALQLKNKFHAEDSLYSYLNEFYGLSFYMLREFDRIDFEHMPQSAVVLMYEDNLERFKKLAGNVDCEIILKSEKGVERPIRKLIAVKYTLKPV